MEIHEYLKQYREEIPSWLATYKASDKISFKDIMSSRIGYYPGFGNDGSLLKVGNMSQAVHSFIHLDYLNTRENIIKQINHVQGYHPIGHIDWRPEDLLPNGPYPFDKYLNSRQREIRDLFSKDSDHHIMTDILQRDFDRDDSHGSERIAITTISADGIEFYYQLFVKEYSVNPFLFLLQDHGFGCNYDKFGNGGILYRIMRQYHSWPTFIICDNVHGTRIYDGYERIENIEPVIGGMHRNVRHLYQRQPHVVF